MIRHNKVKDVIRCCCYYVMIENVLRIKTILHYLFLIQFRVWCHRVGLNTIFKRNVAPTSMV